jgi:hypothetical protein
MSKRADDKRVANAEAKLEKLQNRPGPEKRSGEKVGEYRDRVKRHDQVTERQVSLAAFHLKRKREQRDRRKRLSEKK